MEEKNWLAEAMKKEQLKELTETSSVTEQYGLVLEEKDAELLLEEREKTLKREQRLELGPGILKKLIQTFADSDYIWQENYADTLARLQEIFYLYKNESMDLLTDDELLNFMKEQFETVCFGDLDYLEETCLDIFAQAVRAGYRGYRRTEGRGEYEKFDEITRWDKELYLEVLKELCWR